MPTPNSSDNPLDDLIAEYLEAVDRGDQPDRQQFINAHPEHATELKAYFANLDKFESTKLHAHPQLDATFLPQHEPKPGAIISGRYKLLENIGEGGMGSVWVAEQQQPVKRRVAIKLVKAGMDSKQVLARFEAERQALAVMDHPNIAKVFDGGMTEQGRPYFVMEYVKGVPFTKYCDNARLSLKERLNLFIPVCQAVQHAHHKGIVHRDLKPSNILICLYDGKPVPKVIDFGLAKAMHQSLTEQSIYTGHGIMVGTPLYMSPEQAEHNNLDVDTRTDIYSLGVVLYELLVGTTPLERDQLRKAAIDEVLRLIREVEPPRPSVRLSSSASLPSIAAQRSIDPRHLQKSLAGDLDWIVMKSLEKERTRRYETATGLARDIERFLNDEAVEACPPSRLYRMKKFIRKNRGTVIASSAVFLAMLVGVIGATWGWFRATEAEQTVRDSLGEVAKERDAKNAALEDKTAALSEKSAALTAESTAKDLAERQLIAGILRPIGYADEPNTAELRSFVDWSAIPDTRLKLRILEVAFDDPETALRLARRAERVIQSSVGLSPTRRAIAIELMSAKQRDMNSDARIRVAAAWLALELDSPDLQALSEAITWLFNANGDGTNVRPEFSELVTFIIPRIRTLSRDQQTTVEQPTRPASAPGAHLLSKCSDALIGVLEKSTNDSALKATGKVLVALAPELSAEQTNRGGDAIIGVLERSTDGDTLEAAASGLVYLGPELSTEKITHGWDALIGVLQKSTDRDALAAAGNGLVALAPKLRPEQIKRGCDAMVGVLEKSTDGAAHTAVGNGLAALAPKLSEKEINRSWSALIAVLEYPRSWDASQAAGNGLVALGPKLSPERIMRHWDGLIGVLETTSSNDASQGAGHGLVALAAKLSPEQIARRLDTLIGVLERSHNDTGTAAAGNALGLLAMHLDTARVTKSWNALLQQMYMPERFPFSNHTSAGENLARLASRLDAKQMTHSWDGLIRVLEKSQFSSAHEAVEEALVALAPKLSEEQIAQGCEALIDILQNSESWNVQEAAGNALAAMSAKLNSEQILCGFEAFIHVLTKAQSRGVFRAAGNGLVAFAPRLTHDQISRSGEALIGFLQSTVDEMALQPAVKSLAAISPRLTPEQISRSVTALIGVVQRTPGPSSLQAVGDGLVALAPKLSQDEITRAVDLFSSVLGKTTDHEAQVAAGKNLVGLAPKLNPDLRVRTAELFVASLHRVAGGEITEQIRELMPQLERPTQERISTETMTILLDYLALSDNYFLRQHSNDLSVFSPGVMAMTNERSLASLLQHPAAIGEAREFMLRRFEELVFHDGKHVLLPLPKPLGERQGNYENPPSAIPAADGNEHGGLTPNRSPSEPPPRRFHNLHDAAAWIQQNWPDFDLEATHPVVWRGER